MSQLNEMIHEQFLEYSEQLKEVEKEILRKVRSNEDYSDDVTKAVGLKMMQEEAIKMMAEINN